uniref:ANF_receptor domain-containing protein n=1 Tax=Macrostomum lignano TaxID=282301 RepID=A0A1I8JE36_9PLAT
MMYLWMNETNKNVPEICGNEVRLTHSAFLENNAGKVCLNPHNNGEIRLIKSFHALMNVEAKVTAIGSVPAMLDYKDSGLLVTNDWSYVAIVIEAEDGAVRLSQALQSMSKADQKVCFPIVIQLTSSNATAAAKALRNFVYPDIPRLTVVYSGSGSTFLSLWDLVTGLDALTADLEKRYQLVLVGDALGSFYRATNSTRRRHFGLGTLFVFPGVLDPNPASDSLAVLLKNISSTPESMGEFHRLTDTWSRLQHFKSTTSEQCDWTKFGDLCYTQALIYDFQLLSFLPLIGSALDFSPSGVASLRRKSVSLSDLRSLVPFVDAFLRQNFTDYSLARGLSHRDRGFWQPIVKVYQSRFDSRSEAILEKLGELRIVQAGSANQNYEWDLSTMPELYEFRGGNPDNLPVKAVSGSSVCPRSCPECSKYRGKQSVEYQFGDLYIGALIPVFNRATDVYKCSDGNFDEQSTEWSTAFRYVIKLAAWASEGGATPPPGVDASLVDKQFMLGLRDLVSKVQRSRSTKLKWGYVILDSCYSAPLLTNRLALLLNGKLEPLTGLNYTKFVGFIGEASSTQTMAASQVLKQYSLPIISFASTSTALSDVFQYPFTMRTVSSDNEIIEAMMTILRHYNVDLITVAYAPNAYGLSLRDAMLTRANRDGVCIAKLLVLNCAYTDTVCKRNLANDMRRPGTRYVVFLCDSVDLAAFLNYTEVESDLEFINILATEDIDEVMFTGKNNLGVGTTMVQLVSAPEPGFLNYLNYSLTRMPPNSNNLSQWDRLYFELVHQCYLTDSFVRSDKYTQPCLPSIVASHHIRQLESRS